MRYLTPAQVAERYSGRVSVRTLANWRWSGTGPKFLKLGGRVVYALPDLEAWEARRTVASTSEYRS